MSNTAIVVGAGAGGLVAALYLQRAGLDVTLLEAKGRVGGCAGAFDLAGFRFLAGATTLMGLEPDMPLGLVLAELGIEFNAPIAPRNLRLWQAGQSITLSTDARSNDEQLRARYGAAFAEAWAAGALVGADAWRLVTKLPFPPRGVADLLRAGASMDAWALAPKLVRSTSSWVKQFGAFSEEARVALDELLLVSTQANADSTPALFGALGLEYLQRKLYLPDGGLASLLECLANVFVERGGALRLNAPVRRLTRGPDGFRVALADEALEAERVVLNLTHWDAARIVAPEVGADFERTVERHQDAWAACTLHLGVPDVFSPDDAPYHLVVLPEPLAESKAHAIFVTLSRRDDSTAAPSGFRALTVSCHARTAGWSGLSKAEHDARKARVGVELRAAVELAFPQLKGVEAKVSLPGTPMTWQSFTGRELGRVGGLPFSFSSLSHGYPTGLTPARGLVRVGDTVFPGQSVPACAWGARRVVQHLLSS